MEDCRGAAEGAVKDRRSSETPCWSSEEAEMNLSCSQTLRGCIDLHSGDVSQIGDFHSAPTAAGGSGGEKAERKKQPIRTECQQ